MKKSKIFLAVVVALVALVAIGCGSGTKASQEPANKDTSTNASTSTEAGTSNGDEVAIPQEQPTLLGKVKDVSGNDITIYPAQTVPNDDATNANGQKPPTPSADQSDQGQRPPTPSANQNDQGQRPGNGIGRRMNFSEETKTINVPAGTPIVEMQRGVNKTTTVALTDIKQDQILRIWEKDGTVSFVLIMGGNGPGAGNANGTGNAEQPAAQPDSSQ